MLSDEEVGQKFLEYMKEGRIGFVTFHPSLSYEEFIEGITAETKDGEVRYYIKNGLFKNICYRAIYGALKNCDNEEEEIKELKKYKLEDILRDKDVRKKFSDKFFGLENDLKNEIFENAPKFVLIIDEINRGNIPKIFGELITLLEPDKRIGEENEIIATLPYSQEKFGVPPNLYIIGTMNTADRSIALLDVALRRRFSFVEFAPGSYLEGEWKEWWNNTNKCDNKAIRLTIEAIKAINNKMLGEEDSEIRIVNAKDKLIGHSFAMKIENEKDTLRVWKYEILPLLEEYYRCDYGKIEKLLGKDAFGLIYDENKSIRLDENTDIIEILNKIIERK